MRFVVALFVAMAMLSPVSPAGADPVCFSYVSDPYEVRRGWWVFSDEYVGAAGGGLCPEDDPGGLVATEVCINSGGAGTTLCNTAVGTDGYTGVVRAEAHCVIGYWVGSSYTVGNGAPAYAISTVKFVDCVPPIGDSP